MEPFPPYARNQTVRAYLALSTPNVSDALDRLERVYLPLGQAAESEAARDVVRTLYHHFAKNPEEVPPPYFGPGETPEQAAVDYLAGMTDHYAIRRAERLKTGVSRSLLYHVPQA